MNNNPQLPLGLALQDHARFDSYTPGQNREAVQSLKSCAAGTGESFVYLAGTVGMGKSHLLQAACHHAVQCDRTAAYLSLQKLTGLTPAVLAELEQLDLVCLDDVAVIAGQADWEQGLFGLFNRVRSADGTLVIAAETRADRSGFELPDLVSRLGWGLAYVMKPLGDADILAALVSRAQARGLELQEETAQYLLRHFPRDLTSVFTLLDTLDTASLIEQRRLTIPFIKSVIGSCEQALKP